MNGRKVCRLLLILAALAASGAAMAGRGGWSGGGFYHGGGSAGWGRYNHGGFYRGRGCCGSFGAFYFGPGFAWGYPSPWFGYPYAFWPVAVGDYAPAPAQYVERSPDEQPYSAGGMAPVAGYWYYCEAPAGYYPSVTSCPGGWIQVPPRPPGS